MDARGARGPQAGEDYHDKSALMAEAAEIDECLGATPGGTPRGSTGRGNCKSCRGKKRSDKVTIELYNLEDDPMETTDLAAQDAPRSPEHGQSVRQSALGLRSVDSLNGNDYK